MTIQGVIFDLDGVLARTDHLHFAAWRQMAREAGLQFDEMISRRIRGLSRLASLDAILSANGHDCCAATRQRMADRKNTVFVEMLADLDASAVCPGVHALLAGLRSLGVRVAVGSSSRNARTILERTGLSRLLPIVVDGNDIARAKPDPQVFELAAKGMGVEPAICVVVEDARAGVTAALRCSMRVVGVGALSEVGDAHRVVASLTEIDAASLLSV